MAILFSLSQERGTINLTTRLSKLVSKRQVIVSSASPLVATAFGQHRKFPPHARKTSGNQGRDASLRCLSRRSLAHPRRPRGSQSVREKRRDKSFQAQALLPVLENFRHAFSPGPTDCPWASEDVPCFAPCISSPTLVSRFARNAAFASLGS